MAVALIAFVVQGEVFHDYPVSYFGATVFLFSCASLAVYPELARRALVSARGVRMLRPLAGLSRYAFAIYLFHMPFFIGWLTDGLVSDSPLNRSYLGLLAGLFLVGFAGSLAFATFVAQGGAAGRFRAAGNRGSARRAGRSIPGCEEVGAQPGRRAGLAGRSG